MPSLAASYNYPLLDFFWTIYEIFLWVIWIWILIWIFIDIFRSHDLSGWAKALAAPNPASCSMITKTFGSRQLPQGRVGD